MTMPFFLGEMLTPEAFNAEAYASGKRSLKPYSTAHDAASFATRWFSQQKGTKKGLHVPELYAVRGVNKDNPAESQHGDDPTWIFKWDRKVGDGQWVESRARFWLLPDDE